MPFYHSMLQDNAITFNSFHFFEKKIARIAVDANNCYMFAIPCTEGNRLHKHVACFRIPFMYTCIMLVNHLC